MKYKSYFNKNYYEENYSEKSDALRFKKQTQFINLFMQYVPKGKVVEFGFGGGHSLKLMHDKGYDVIGYDVNEHGAERVRKRFDIDARYGDAEKIIAQYPETEDRFDGILLINFLSEGISNQLEFMKHLHKWIKKNGHVLIVLPNYDSLAWKKSYPKLRTWFPDKKTFKTLMNDTDWKIVTIKRDGILNNHIIAILKEE